MWIAAAFPALRRTVAVVAVVAGVSACASGGPYVFNPREFDREAPGFGREPQDIEAVEICYRSTATTAEVVRDLASQRCGEYGKRAVFHGQDYLECPLSTPVRARYRCVATR